MKYVTLGNNRIVRSSALALAAFAAMGGAHAATATTTFKAKIVITESCSFTATPAVDVDFGTQARATTAVTVDNAGSVTVNCTPGTSYTLGLNGGLNTIGTIATPVAGDRRMRLGSTGSNYVGYELYQNTGRTTFWGNASGTWVSGTGTGVNVTVPVYGRVINVNAVAGSYEDTITATITY